MRSFLLPGLALLLAAGCGGGKTIEPTYANVEETVMTSCAISSSCHAGEGAAKARLNFERALTEDGDILGVLVDRPACEYDLMDRVEPGDPESSWLWIKLDPAHADADGNIEFEPDPSFDPDTSSPSVCPLVTGGELSFGTNMPQSIGEPTPLDGPRLRMFREWIEMGAPGPE